MSSSQSMLPAAAALASPGSLLEMNISGPTPETWGETQKSVFQQALWVILVRTKIC